MTIEQLANQGVSLNLPWASLAIGAGLEIIILMIGGVLPKIFKFEHLASVPRSFMYFLMFVLITGIIMLAGAAFEIFFGHFGISSVNYVNHLTG